MFIDSLKSHVVRVSFSNCFFKRGQHEDWPIVEQFKLFQVMIILYMVILGKAHLSTQKKHDEVKKEEEKPSFLIVQRTFGPKLFLKSAVVMYT